MSEDAYWKDREKDQPDINDVSTLLWDKGMGERLALWRMKRFWDQTELAKALGVNQSTISRLEIGHLRVCEKILLKKYRLVFDKDFSFIAFGTGLGRFNRETIHKEYWRHKLRLQRKNKSPLGPNIKW